MFELTSNGVAKYFQYDGYLFSIDKLCPRRCTLRELLFREAHHGVLKRDYGVTKTILIMQEYFYGTQLRKDMKRVVQRCIKCKEVKSKVQPHGLYIPLLVPSMS